MLRRPEGPEEAGGPGVLFSATGGGAVLGKYLGFRRVGVNLGMRNAENRQRVKSGKFDTERS